MIIEIETKAALDKIRARLKKMPEEMRWAISRTLNDVAVSGRQIAVKDILARYNIADKPVRSGMKIEKARVDRLLAIIHVSGYRFPIQMFDPVATKEGVDFEEIRGKRSSISHVFMAVMRYGPNVFVRKGAERGPVQKITGLSVASMVKEETQVLPDIQARVDEQLLKRAEFWMAEALAGKMANYGGGGGGEE